MKPVIYITPEGSANVILDCPEEPKWHEIPATPDSSDYEIRDEQRQEYEQALAEAKKNSIPFEDQAQIKAIIKAMIGHDLDLMTIDTTGYEYPFPSDQYKVEIKRVKAEMKAPNDAGKRYRDWKTVAVLSPLKPQEDKLISEPKDIEQ